MTPQKLKSKLKTKKTPKKFKQVYVFTIRTLTKTRMLLSWKISYFSSSCSSFSKFSTLRSQLKKHSNLTRNPNLFSPLLLKLKHPKKKIWLRKQPRQPQNNQLSMNPDFMINTGNRCICSKSISNSMARILILIRIKAITPSKLTSPHRWEQLIATCNLSTTIIRCNLDTKFSLQFRHPINISVSNYLFLLCQHLHQRNH